MIFQQDNYSNNLIKGNEMYNPEYDYNQDYREDSKGKVTMTEKLKADIEEYKQLCIDSAEMIRETFVAGYEGFNGIPNCYGGHAEKLRRNQK